MITWENSLTLNIFGQKYTLVETSPSAPEQYEVYIDDKEIGFLRLRHGTFRAEYRSKTVYEKKDPAQDDHFFDIARERYLTEAIFAIHLCYTAKELPPHRLS